MTAVFRIKITGFELWDTGKFPYISCFKAIVSPGALCLSSSCRIIVEMTPRERAGKQSDIYLGERLHPWGATCQLVTGYSTQPRNQLSKNHTLLSSAVWGISQACRKRHPAFLTPRRWNHQVGATPRPEAQAWGFFRGPTASLPCCSPLPKACYHLQAAESCWDRGSSIPIILCCSLSPKSM